MAVHRLQARDRPYPPHCCCSLLGSMGIVTRTCHDPAGFLPTAATQRPQLQGHTCDGSLVAQRAGHRWFIASVRPRSRVPAGTGALWAGLAGPRPQVHLPGPAFACSAPAKQAGSHHRGAETPPCPPRRAKSPHLVVGVALVVPAAGWWACCWGSGCDASVNDAASTARWPRPNGPVGPAPPWPSLPAPATLICVWPGLGFTCGCNRPCPLLSTALRRAQGSG